MLPKLLLGLLLLNAAKASCPEGTIYESNFNKCFKFVNKPLSFLESEQSCQAIGGHLVAISNAFENGYVAGIPGAPTKFWIGANLLRKTSWTWVGNESFGFNNWAAGQPSAPTTNQCGAFRNGDNRWTAEVCNSVLPFLCSVSANVATEQCPSATCPTLPASCDGLVCSDGYQLYPGTCRCYKYYSSFDPISYSTAETTCNADNGALAKVTSSHHNDFLYSTVKTGPLSPWIGLKCPTSSIASCRWPDGSNVLCYSNVARGSPNGKFQSVYLDNDKFWYSDTSDSGNAFICEKAPNSVHQLPQERWKFYTNVDTSKL